jgi:hypothetical protein
MDVSNPSPAKKSRADDQATIRANQHAERQVTLQSIKMLVLVPQVKTFEYSLVCSDEDSHDFYRWVNQGSNNIDFLVEYRGRVFPIEELGPLLVFENTPNGPQALCNEGNMMLAFLAAKKLGITEHGLLQFTFINNFLLALSSDGRRSWCQHGCRRWFQHGCRSWCRCGRRSQFGGPHRCRHIGMCKHHDSYYLMFQEWEKQ